MRKPRETHVEVDMVPLIDIVTLLLMFLIIVGDTAKSANAIQMRLPCADQAKDEKKEGIRTEGRIVIQMDKNPKTDAYFAVVAGTEYDIQPGGKRSYLLDFLRKHVDTQLRLGKVKPGPNGEVDIPVKLRIPESAPMRDVEGVVKACTKVDLVNIHYAAVATR